MQQPGSTRSGFASLADWLAWLETLSPTEINLGLDRVLAVHRRLKPARPGRVIHVAGTNGKGSTVAMLESLFIGAGERVGAYTSPHLISFNERIRVNGTPVSDAELIAAFKRVDAARQNVPLTYFEFGTLAALVVFEKYETATVILEIGMGGRLDAVNAVEPDGGIITNVSLDHCEWLGAHIEAIATEKAGILRGDKPFVYGALDAPVSILNVADELGTDLRRLGQDFDFALETASRDTWAWSGRRTKIRSLDLPALSGTFQLQNAAAALALVEAMRCGALLNRDLINAAFKRLHLAGRCQLLQTDRRWLLDVAHNAGAASVLSEILADRYGHRRIVAIFGLLRDKDLGGVVSPLLEAVDAWVTVRAENTRALEARELAAGIAELSDKPCQMADSLPNALEIARRQTDTEDLILVTGSFYVVGPALRWFESACGQVK